MEACFGKTAVPILLTRLPSRVSSEAPSTTFFDRLDIFSDAIDIINTLGGYISGISNLLTYLGAIGDISGIELAILTNSLSGIKKTHHFLLKGVLKKTKLYIYIYYIYQK